MTRKTVTELYTQAQTDFADNAIGAITPAKLRQFCLDFLDTIRPSYAVAGLNVRVSKASTPTPTAMVWNVVEDQSADFSVSLASGTVTRNNGPAVGRITFNMDVEAPNNVITKFTLFVNDVETPWSISNTSTSGTDIQSYSLSAINYSPETLINYVVQVSTNVNATLYLNNGAFIVENVPLDNP